MKLNQLLKKNYFQILLTLLLVSLLGLSVNFIYKINKEGFTESDAKNEDIKSVYLNSLATKDYLQFITKTVGSMKSNKAIDDNDIHNLTNYAQIATTSVTSIINLINDIYPKTPHITIIPRKEAKIATSSS